MKWVPRTYQSAMIDFALSHLKPTGNLRCNWFAGMGVGKSSSALRLIDILLTSGYVNRVLILAPKQVAVGTWPDEIRGWQDFRHLRYAVAVGGKKERAAAVASRTDIVIVNYDVLPAMLKEFGEKWPFDMVVADECFVAGTPIATPSGDRSIEDIRVGDLVLSHLGYRRVTRVYRTVKTVLNLVSLQLSNGVVLNVTREHPIFTDAGWLPAGDCLGRKLYGYADLRDVQAAVCSQALQSSGEDSEGPDSILFEILPNQGNFQIQPFVTGGCSEAHDGEHSCESHASVEFGQTVVRGAPKTCIRTHEGDWTQTEGSGWQRKGHVPDRGASSTYDADRVYMELCRTVGAEAARLSVSLQARLREPRTEDRTGSGREFTHFGVGQIPRCEKDGDAEFIRVEGISHYECGSVATVFNLEVESAHTYFVHGILVHNCTRLKSLRVTVRTSSKGKEFVVGQGGKQARSIAKLAHSRIKVWLGMTGSPAPNGLIDTWAPMWFVDAGQRLGRSFSAFKGRWFREFKDKDERTHLEPYEHSQDEIQSRIKDVCMTVEAKDFFDLPPLVESIVRVELPPDAMRMYREFEEEMFLEIAGNEIEAFDAASVTNKCRQISNGAVYTDREGNWQFIHDAKIDALRDCVEEAAGMPILVAYQFKSDVARILKAFPKAVLVDKDPETIRRWNRGEIQMLLGHPASIGHGLSLQHGGNILVDFSTGFNLEHDEQIIERIGPTRQAQSGYNRAVYRRRIVAAGTIEEYVVKRVKTKASIQQMLREAMKIA